VISWIGIEDLCRLFMHAIKHEEMNGVYNAVAPHPVTNKQLTMQLAKKMRGKFFIPVYVPAFVLKIMLGEMSIEVLKSATVNSHKTKTVGFSFISPTVDAVLELLLHK